MLAKRNEAIKRKAVLQLYSVKAAHGNAKGGN